MNDILQYLLETGICLAFFYGIYWIFLKKETFFLFNRIFLILSIPLALIIPLINITSPFRTSPPRMSSVTAVPSNMVSAPSFFIYDIFLLIFFLGAGFFLFRFVLRLAQIQFLIRKCGYFNYNGVKVVLTDEDTAPFSFFHYLFINKEEFESQGFERILTHEWAHMRQYHSIDLLLMECLTVIQWFNPFVWPYKKSLKETHEYLADQAVIAQGCSRVKYQLLIFEQHVGLKMFEFTNNFSQSLIKRRITMMAKNKSKGGARLKVLLVLPVLILLVLVFAESKPVTDQAEHGAAFSESGVLHQPYAWDQEEKTAKEKELEKKKKMKLILEQETELKKLYEKTEDPEKKVEIKAKLNKIQAWKKENGWVKTEHGEKPYTDIVKELKAAYEKTDDPEKKKEIKEKLMMLEKEYAAGKANGKSEIMENKKIEELKARYLEVDKLQKMLKAKYEKTDDPEVKKKLKEKVAFLEKEKENIKKVITKTKAKKNK
ncbi:MAG: M56 family metallopeptidase [Candidatus Aminicenantes bacterium]|nr:M56 family metallopeptidase [Candidatus Aminicenantes bacterium]